MNEVSNILRGIRNEIGLSQKDFASRIGMKPVADNMVESGKNQLAYILLTNIITAFKVDPNRLFRVTNDDGSLNIKLPKSEAEFLNEVHALSNKIYNLYQDLISIRILLFQELKIKGDLSTQTEVELLNKLTRPDIKESDQEKTLHWPYENLNDLEKVEYLQKLNACVELFTNTFFGCFNQLYKGIVIPATKEMHPEFFKEREKNTDNWKYTHYMKSR